MEKWATRPAFHLSPSTSHLSPSPSAPRANVAKGGAGRPVRHSVGVRDGAGSLLCVKFLFCVFCAFLRLFPDSLPLSVFVSLCEIFLSSRAIRRTTHSGSADPCFCMTGIKWLSDLNY